MTGGRFVVGRLVLEIDRGIEADEPGGSSTLHHAQSLHGGADGACFAAVRMHVDLGVRDALPDVIDLRFDRCQVVLRAPLKDELAPERGHARHADDVLPDVLRENLRETGEELFFAEAFLLEVHAVGVEKDRTAVAEAGGQLGLECRLCVLGDWQAELVGHRLKQHAVAGGALVGQLEGLDVTVLHEQDLDVLAPDVADHVDVAEVVGGTHHVRDRLDDVDVGTNALLEHVCCVTGCAKAKDFDLGTLGAHAAPELAEELLAVLNGVALRKGVRLHQDFALFAEQDGFGGSASSVEADDRSHRLGFDLRLDEHRNVIRAQELLELQLVTSERRARSLPKTLLAPLGDVTTQALEALVDANIRWLV